MTQSDWSGQLNIVRVKRFWQCNLGPKSLQSKFIKTELRKASSHLAARKTQFFQSPKWKAMNYITMWIWPWKQGLPHNKLQNTHCRHPECEARGWGMEVILVILYLDVTPQDTALQITNWVFSWMILALDFHLFVSITLVTCGIFSSFVCLAKPFSSFTINSHRPSLTLHFGWHEGQLSWSQRSYPSATLQHQDYSYQMNVQWRWRFSL